MTRVHVAVVGAILAMLALPARAAVPDPPVSQWEGGDLAADVLDEIALPIAVSDGVGFVPGALVETLGEFSRVGILGEDGTGSVIVPVGRFTDLRVSDETGAFWTTTLGPVTATERPEALLVLLAGDDSRLFLSGPDPSDLEAFDQVLDGMEARWDELESRGELPDLGQRRVSPSRAGLARRGAAPGRTVGLDLDAIGYGDGASGNVLHSADVGGTAGLPGLRPVRPVPMAWTGESEPNNTGALCNSIAAVDFNVPLSPQAIGSTADTDYYCFTPTCGDTVTITITPSGTLRPRLDLFHSTANTLATSSQFAVTPATVTLTNAEAIPYVFQVRSNSSTTGSYTILVATAAGTCLVDPFEPTWGTDEAAAACAIPPAPGAQLIAPPLAPATLVQDRSITWAGTLSTGRDIDTYCLNLDCGQGLNVVVTPRNATFSAQVKFIAPVLVTSSSNVYRQFNGTAGQPLAASIAPAIQSGIWKVEITTSGANKGDYQVSFQKFDSPYTCFDSYEPDDTPADCTPLATDGTRQSHVLFPVWNGPAVGGTEEQDWFCFDVAECGSRVVIETLPTFPTLDDPEPSLTVYAPDGSALVSESSGGHRTIHAVVAFTAKVPGTYTAKVFCTGVPPYTNDSAGQYDILVNVIDDKDPLVLDVAQTELPDTTVLDARATAEITDPLWLLSVAPGPGAVDIGSLPGQTFGPNLNGNRYTTAVNLPFTFPFFGVDRTQVRISEAGYLTFDPASSGITFPSCIPDTINNVNDAVYAFWTGLTGRRSQVTSPAQELVPGARVTAETVGTPGNREFTVTWSHVARAFSSVTTPAGDHNFSATLREATGEVVVRYGRMAGHPGVNGQNATIGLENRTSTAAVVYGCYQPFVTEGLILRYVPDGAGSYTIVEERAPTLAVDYPAPRSCQYDVVQDLAPLEDISATGTPITAGATVGVNWTSYGPFPFSPPGAPPAPLAATNLDEGWVQRSVPWASGRFPFHGVDETTFLVHVNGFLSFGVNAFNGTMIPADHARANQCPLPFMAHVNGVIAPFWDDLLLATPAGGFPPSPGYTGGAVYELLDDPPGPDNARYIVQWSNAVVNAPGSTGAATIANWQVNFQVILHETGGIEYRYGNMGGATPHHMATGTSATVGVESTTGGAPYHGAMTSGATWWCGTSNAAGIQPMLGPMRNGLRLRFNPLAASTASFEWRDVATDALLATGPQYVADETTPCQVRLVGTVRDPDLCCDVTSSRVIDIADRWAPLVTGVPALGIDGSACTFLWPPQHGYVDFDLSRTGASGITAVDACGNGVVVELSTILSSQPEDAVDDLGDGESFDDAMISPDRQSFSVRAERAGACQQLDRSYTVVFRVRDSLGNSRDVASLPICVYHDRGHDPPGPHFSANPDSNANDTRPGWIEGEYGTGCGDGCSLDCDPTQTR